MVSSYGKLEGQDIVEFQIQHNLIFPLDYARYLLENNGGSAGTKMISFDAKGIDEPIALGALFGLKHSKEGLSIETWQKACRHDLLENMVVIGKTVFPGLILLLNQEKLKGVYFWDYSCIYPESEQYKCVHYIAKTFEAFYSGLYIPEKQRGLNLDLQSVIDLGLTLIDDCTLHHHGDGGRTVQVVNAIIHQQFTQIGEIPNPKKYKYYRVAFFDRYGPLLRRKRKGGARTIIEIKVRSEPRTENEN